MYKKAFTCIGNMLESARAGDKWEVMTNKDAAMRAAHDVFTMKQIEAAYEYARDTLKRKGAL